MIAFEPLVLAPALLAAALYARGFTTLARRMPYRFGPWRMVAYMAGLAVVLLAASSLLDELSHALLQAHMTQHLLLMLVAPPLLWMGAPVAPLLLGLPRPLRRVVARWLGTPALRRLARELAHPALGWTAFVIAFWAWHVPALYDLALRSDAWHHVEHASFFATALLFWRPVILPWPSRASWPRWTMIPYLVLAEFHNTTLAAIFSFSDRVIYPAYEAGPRPWGLSALEDQSIAGAIMWLPGSIAFLLPLLWLILTAVAGPKAGSNTVEAAGAQPALRSR
ncbi:MAG TPA: cytochrome c oxidase assembly protein [Methylomirabilota bacterium]